MIRSDNLSTTAKKKSNKRLGRGNGSGLGTTCGRGMKGAGSRSGYRRRLGYEGGNIPFFRRFPKKGFTRGMFLRPLNIINLDQINDVYSDGETVSLETLFEKGFLKGSSFGIKVLGRGNLEKKVKIIASEISSSAIKKLTDSGIDFSIEDLS